MSASTATAPAGLTADGISVRFGGHLALDNVTLRADAGSITGLIGPNGAGKTTTFNACTGLLRPDGGAISLFGDDVTSARPPARAQRGLGRTFQRVEVCNVMSVRTNVGLSLEARLAGSNPFRQVVAGRARRAAVAKATEEALERCGLTAMADEPVGRLSTGQRRLVELARVIAGGFRMLLLDEPSSGLDREETAAFGAIVSNLVAEKQVGVLLVEHDMSLVMDICSYLYVLDFGRMIFDGTPAEVQASPIVRSAYLGDPEELDASLPGTESEVA